MAFREFDPARGAWPMSRLSVLVARLTDRRKVTALRRRNYCVLMQRIEASRSLRPLLPDLPRGSSPWLFPIQVEDRDSLWRYLAANGVESYRFWRLGHASVPTEGYEHESALRGHLLALPVHQDLTEAEVSRIADLVNAWSRRQVVQATSVPATQF
jgi:dTDP-4-amino-4,6-dideoxygalactose transaminase